jgi:hypothetical protein
LQVQVLSRGPILPEPGSGARGFGQAISWLAARPQVRRSERQYHFGMSTGQGSGLFAKQCAPFIGRVVQVHGIPPFYKRQCPADRGKGFAIFARSDKRSGNKSKKFFAAFR